MSVPHPDSLTGLIPTSKRSACDRCHNLKLRCPARVDRTLPCARCLSVGTRCVTGYWKPLGHVARSRVRDTPTPLLMKPPLPDASPILDSSVQTNTATASAMDSSSEPIFCTSESLILPTPTAATTTHMDVPWTSLVDPMASAGKGDSSLIDLDTFPTSMVDSCADFLAFHSFGPSNTSTLTSPIPDFPSVEAHTVRSISSSSYGSGKILTPLTSPAVGTMKFSEESTHTETEPWKQQLLPCMKHPFSASDCDPRLHSLALGLSRRLTLSHNTNPSDLDMLGTPGKNDRNSNGQLDMPGSHDFGDALRHTAELLAIIGSYEQHHCRHDVLSAELNYSDESSLFSPSLGMVTILNILSIYLQIIATYDSLFQRLQEQLRQSMSPDSRCIAGLQTLPGLQLATFSVEHGNLQTKILIQAILHQMESIEKTLGLPPEFRVSDRQDDIYTVGLLADERYRDLIRAVMSSQCTQDVTGHCCGSGMKALRSLRNRIMEVKQILET